MAVREIREVTCDCCGDVIEGGAVRIHPNGYDTYGISVCNSKGETTDLNVEDKDFCSVSCLASYISEEITNTEK